MSDAGSTSSEPRPRQVTFAGTQAIIGSLLAIIMLIGAMQQLNGSAMTDVLRQVLDSPQAGQLQLTLDTLRTVVKYSIMGLAVLSVASLVLGFYVLRRDRGARVALTVVGGIVLLLTLLTGPTGWAVSLYIAISLGLLWSRPARVWFARHDESAGPPPGVYPPPPPGWQPPPPPPR